MSGIRAKSSSDALAQFRAIADKAFTEGGDKLVSLSGSTLITKNFGFFERISTIFKQKNAAIWERFRLALVGRYGDAAVRMSGIDFKALSSRKQKMTLDMIEPIRERVRIEHGVDESGLTINQLTQDAQGMAPYTRVRINSHGDAVESTGIDKEQNSTTWLRLRHALEKRYSVEAVANCLIDFDKHINEGTPLPVSFISTANAAVRLEQSALSRARPKGAHVLQSFLALVDSTQSPSKQIILDDKARLCALDPEEVKSIALEQVNPYDYDDYDYDDSATMIGNINRVNTRTWLHLKHALVEEFSEEAVSKCGFDFDKAISKGEILTTAMVRNIVADASKAHDLYGQQDDLSKLLQTPFSDSSRREAWLGLKAALEKKFGKNICTLMKTSFEDIINSGAKFDQKNIGIIAARAYRSHRQSTLTLTLDDYRQQASRMDANETMIISDAGLLVADKNKQAIYPQDVNTQTWQRFYHALTKEFSSDAVRNIGVDFSKLAARGAKLTAGMVADIISKVSLEHESIGAAIGADEFITQANQVARDSLMFINVDGEIGTTNRLTFSDIKKVNARLWLKFRRALINQHSHEAISKLDTYFEKYVNKGAPLTAGLVRAMSSMAQKLGTLYSVDDDLKIFLDIVYSMDPADAPAILIRSNNRFDPNNPRHAHAGSVKAWSDFAQGLRARFGDDIERKMGMSFKKLIANRVLLTTSLAGDIIDRAYRAHTLGRTRLTIDDFETQAQRLKPRDAIILSDTGMLVGDEILVDMVPKQAHARTWKMFRKALEQRFSPEAIFGLRVDFEKMIAKGAKLTSKLVTEITNKAQIEHSAMGQYEIDDLDEVLEDAQSTTAKSLMAAGGSIDKKTHQARLWASYYQDMINKTSEESVAKIRSSVRKYILSGKEFSLKNASPLTAIVSREHSIATNITNSDAFVKMAQLALQNRQAIEDTLKDAREAGDKAIEKQLTHALRRNPTDVIWANDDGALVDTFDKNGSVNLQQANAQTWACFRRTLIRDYSENIVRGSGVDFNSFINQGKPLTASDVMLVRNRIKQYKDSLDEKAQTSSVGIVPSAPAAATARDIKADVSLQIVPTLPRTDKPTAARSHSTAVATTTTSATTKGTVLKASSTMGRATESAPQDRELVGLHDEAIRTSLAASNITRVGAPWPPVGFTPVKFDINMRAELIQGRDNTCFMLSVFRGMMENEAGITELNDRVVQEGGMYKVRLTYHGEDYVVSLNARELSGLPIPSRNNHIRALVGAMSKFLQCTNPKGTSREAYTFGKMWVAEDVAHALGWRSVEGLSQFMPNDDELHDEIFEQRPIVTTLIGAARAQEYLAALRSAGYDRDKVQYVIDQYRSETYPLRIRQGLEHILQNRGLIAVYNENRHYVQLGYDSQTRSVIVGNSLTSSLGMYDEHSRIINSGATTSHISMDELITQYIRGRRRTERAYHAGYAVMGTEISVFTRG